MKSAWQKKTPEQKARYVANARMKRAVKAIAEGRVPGKTGTPKKLITEEQVEAARVRNNKRRSKLSLKIRTAKRAAKALSEGRTPGKCGPRKVSDAELKASTEAVQKRFRENNLEHRRDYERKWKEDLRATEEGRKYLQDQAVVHGAKRRAQKNRANGSHTREDIRALFFEQNGKCGLCELALDANNYHVDHWKPLSKGGSNGKENLKLLHPKCNRVKHTKLPEELKIGA